MGGKHGVSRLGARFAVVLAFTVLGNVAISGIAAAAPKACSGRVSAACTTQTGHTTKGTQIVEGSDSTPVIAPVAAPATVSAPVASKASVKAPSAPKASAGKTATRADHKGHDSEPDPETGVDPDCDEDDVDDAPDADDDDDEDCTSGGTPDPEPCDDGENDDDDDGDDDGEGDDDEDCETPEPPVPPTPPTPPAPPAPPAAPGTTVLPRQIDRLPTTGADVTSLFLIGLLLVAIGGATRIRTTPLRVVFAGQGSAAELILIQYMNHVATQRTMRARRR